MMFASSAAGDEGGDASRAFFNGRVRPLIQKYCLQCHDAETRTAGLAIDALTTPDRLFKDRGTAERIAEYLRDQIMPPEDEPQPPKAEAKAVADWIDAEFARRDRLRPKDPGRVTVRRLNRAEYNNTIRDLLGVDFRPAESFPADDLGYGFDNIGDVLSMQPVLLEKYLAAAEQIAEKAVYVHDPKRAPAQRFGPEQMRGGQSRGPRGRILASNGETFVEASLPRDGSYVLRVTAFGQQAGNEPAKMALRLDGKRLRETAVPATFERPGTYEVSFRGRAGVHKFGAEFLNDYYNEKAKEKRRRDRNLIVMSIEVRGPVDFSPQDLPESHKRILFCQPSASLSKRQCAEQILGLLARRAFRRPVAKEEVDRLVEWVGRNLEPGEPFERAIQLGLKAILVSPHFLFRVEIDPEPTNPKASRKLNDWELASRLSYFLWSSMPDEELFQLAEEGRLQRPEVLEEQVRRMLRDPKAKALTENFAGQWLETRKLAGVTPDPKLFASFTPTLREAMRRETELFFEFVLKEDRSVLEFIDADYSFLNERLAKHYGVAGVTGEAFRRVRFPDGQRGGLLTQGTFLTITSNPNRTSPVKRGKWVLEQILGTPPPPPPPGVPELKDDKNAALSGTLKQRMEQHRSNPACASCHQRMDPIGFGLENFDAIGRWRTKDGDHAIDTAGKLPSGESFAGPRELKTVLREKKELFVRNLSEKMLTYALGRGTEIYDRPTIDRLAARVAEDGYRFSTLIYEVTKTDAFLMRRGEAGDEHK